MWPVTDQCYAVSISKGRTLTGLGRLSGLKLVLCHQFSASQNIFKSRYKQRTTATSRKAEEILAVDLPHGEPQLDAIKDKISAASARVKKLPAGEIQCLGEGKEGQEKHAGPTGRTKGQNFINEELKDKLERHSGKIQILHLTFCVFYYFVGLPIYS